jgi:hypothetical protein
MVPLANEATNNLAVPREVLEAELRSMYRCRIPIAKVA